MENAVKASQRAEPEEIGVGQAQSMLAELTRTLTIETIRGITYAAAQQLVSNLLHSRLSPRAEGDVMAEIYKIIDWLKARQKN